MIEIKNGVDRKKKKKKRKIKRIIKIQCDEKKNGVEMEKKEKLIEK